MSPAELAKLEHAFATDPASEAYKPLAEAYLTMGRFMEAMVVCKKGVKAHPNAADPRLLLARVYADQGKDKKAIEELQGALQIAAQDKSVLRMLGVLQLKNGENDAGKANLLKAHEVDPADAETQSVLAQWKLEPPRPAAPAPAPVAAPQPVAAAPMPAPAPVAAQAPMAGPGTMAPRPATTGPRISASNIPVVTAQEPPRLQPVQPEQASIMVDPSLTAAAAPVQQAPVQQAPVQQAPVQQAPVQMRTSSNGVPAVNRSGGYPAQPRTMSRSNIAAVPAPDLDDDDEEDDEEVSTSRKPARTKPRSTGTRAIFLVMLIGMPIALGAYFYVGQRNARINRDIKKALTEASEQLKHDSYDSYKKACEAADKALDLDARSTTAHAYLAYAYAVRWGEHGGGDAARKAAEEHLEAAKKGEVSSYQVAAEALIKTYSGKGSEALQELSDKVKQFDAEGRQSSLLYLTLGLAQMNAGDLELARENLEKAQSLATDDSRVYSALGDLYRRRGQDSLAAKYYEQALRYEKNHPGSLLGAALLLLDQENPKFPVAQKMLKTLIDSDPPPSPRQLAAAHMERGLLIARASKAMEGMDPDSQKALSEATGVPADKNRAQAEVAKAEETGFTLDRQNPELHLIKGRRLLYEGNVDAAAAEIREAIKMDPARALFHAELAKVLMQKNGGEVEAKEALTTAINKMGPSPKLLVLLGNAYKKMGKLDDAISQYTRAVSDTKTKNPEARLALGVALREKKDYSEAQRVLEKAAQEYVGQSSKVAAVQTELGRLFEAKEDRTKAEDAYTKALNSDPDYAPAYFFYARFLSSGKDSGKAKATAQEYLRREPHGEYAVEAQRMVQ